MRGFCGTNVKKFLAVRMDLDSQHSLDNTFQRDAERVRLRVCSDDDCPLIAYSSGRRILVAVERFGLWLIIGPSRKCLCDLRGMVKTGWSRSGSGVFPPLACWGGRVFPPLHEPVEQVRHQSASVGSFCRA